MMDSASQEDAGADIGPDIHEDEVRLHPRGAVILLPLRGQICIVLHNHQTLYDLFQHGAQGHRPPAFQGADRKDAALLHVCDRRHAHDQGQQLGARLFLLPQESLQLVPDVATDGFWSRSPIDKQDLLCPDFVPIQIGQQK